MVYQQQWLLRMKKRAYLLSLALILSSPSVLAQSAKDRLLSTEDAKNLIAETKQDGRALRINIHNGSSMVVTSFTVNCSAKSIFAEIHENTCRAKAGSHIKKSPSQVDDCTYSFMGEKALEKEVTEKLKPGKAAEHYFEIKDGLVNASCWIKDPRGRAAKWYE
ncbi:hypothetical protein E4O93_07420 [Diaphorobacter sp. DS2]|nr:hypothetical protein E4O93_07420 [Diaphorobacter sp. DS2]